MGQKHQKVSASKRNKGLRNVSPGQGLVETRFMVLNQGKVITEVCYTLLGSNTTSQESVDQDVEAEAAGSMEEVGAALPGQTSCR